MRVYFRCLFAGQTKAVNISFTVLRRYTYLVDRLKHFDYFSSSSTPLSVALPFCIAQDFP